MKSNTDYALNKLNKDAIVSVDAFGQVTYLTASDFSSEEEFLKWKDWSDEDYHEIECHNHREQNHTVYINDLSEVSILVHSAEDCFIRKLTIAKARAQRELLRQNMTPTQFRCLTMYYEEGMSQEQIAKVMGVSQQRVSSVIQKGLQAAKRYVEK